MGEVDNGKTKQLKTVENIADDSTENNDQLNEADEYQHIKDAEQNHKLTLDNATETQSKQTVHQNEKVVEEDDNDEVNNQENDHLIDEYDEPEMSDMKPNELDPERNSDEKSKKSNKEKSGEGLLKEVIEVDGENIQTMNVPRKAETTAHCQKHFLTDKMEIDENTFQNLSLRKRFMDQLSTKKMVKIFIV